MKDSPMAGCGDAYRRALEFANTNIAESCAFAFNSNIDFVAYPSLDAAERAFGKRITRGGETVDAATVRRVASAFKWKEARMGGQSGNMANAGAALGVRGLAHAYNLGPRQKRLFAKGVEAIGGNRVRESCHYICEVTLRDGRRDRLIASHDPAHFKLQIAKKFASRSTAFIGEGCDRAMVSGFHIIAHSSARERMKAAARLLGQWKQANPELRVQFEAGDFARKEVLLDTVKMILPHVDSIGLNGDEVHEFARAFGLPKRHAFEAARLLAEKVPEVVVHTADYAFAYSRIRPKPVLRHALCFGHSLAAYRALTGRYATFADVSLMLGNKVECRAGSQAAREFEEAGFGKHGVIVPSLALKPKMTVGLGDSFAAGFFLVG